MSYASGLGMMLLDQWSHRNLQTLDKLHKRDELKALKRRWK